MFRLSAPGEGGNPPDEGLTVDAPGREGSGQEAGGSESGVVAGGGDATLVEGDETVNLSDGSDQDGHKLGDPEAGQQGGFRTLAPGEGGNPPDDEK
jgi:hypothetical protein